MELYTAFGTH